MSLADMNREAQTRILGLEEDNRRLREALESERAWLSQEITRWGGDHEETSCVLAEHLKTRRMAIEDALAAEKPCDCNVPPGYSCGHGKVARAEKPPEPKENP